MKVVDNTDAVESDRFEALIITGNGRSEYRRLKPLCEHFDEDRQLLLPSTTERHLSVVGGQSYPDTERRGWDALDAIRLYKSKFHIERYLFLVDQEHCEETGEAEFEEKVTELATRDEFEITEIEDGAYRADFKIGSRDIVLFAAAVGDEFGFFEDCLANLLLFEWGNSIDEESKEEFKAAVNQNLSGGAGRTLLSQADRHNINRAFPALSSVLREIEN